MDAGKLYVRSDNSSSNHSGGKHYSDLKLGQIIKVQNKEYLVVNVECKTEEKRLVLNKEQEVVPLDTTPTLLFKVKAISKITNWKNLDGKEEPDTFCPTIIPAGHIRTSGPQLATVTDADDPNNQNRVRIMFPAWQNVPETMDDKTKEASSPWIVYATSSASKGNGIFGRHYEGDQVIVNFAHGNVERPYIVGGLSMKGNKVPGEFLERDIVLTSPGGHALRIEDGSGAGLTAFLSGTILPGYELLTTWFPSLGGQDIFKLFGNDTLTMNSKAFEGGFQLTDKYGVYSITGSTDGRNVSVKSPWGDVNISAFTGISIEAPNGDISIKGKNVSIEAGNNLELISGTNVSYRKFKHGDSGLGTVGLSLAEIPIAAAKKLASKINIIDFSYLRSIAEVVFRPVEGALTVKSNRFLKLEAGKDQCDYPAAAYTSQALKSMHAKDEKAIRKGIKTQASVIELISKVGVLAGEVDRKYRERVRYNARDGVNDRDGTPCSGSASEIGDQTDSDRLDQHTGAESEHKADGAHLYALVIIFCDERRQSGIRDVVGCVEACVKKRVGDKEPCILSCRSEIRRYAENGDEAERAAEVAIEHPGTCFSHLCLGLVDQRTEENIAHTVKEL